MKVLVCGARIYTDRFGVWQAILALRPRPTTIIHGDADGADTLAAEWAAVNGVEALAFPADWSEGRSAGPKRNARMLVVGKPDRGLAFGALWEPDSMRIAAEAKAAVPDPRAVWRRTGTGDMVHRMLLAGLPVRWVASPDAPAVDLTVMPPAGGGR